MSIMDKCWLMLEKKNLRREMVVWQLPCWVVLEKIWTIILVDLEACLQLLTQYSFFGNLIDILERHLFILSQVL